MECVMAEAGLWQALASSAGLMVCDDRVGCYGSRHGIYICLVMMGQVRSYFSQEYYRGLYRALARQGASDQLSAKKRH